MHRVLGSRPLANDGCVSDSLRTTVEDDPLLGISENEDYLFLGDATDDNTDCSTSLPSGSSNSDASSSATLLDTTPHQAKNTFVVRKTKRPQSENTLLQKLLENDDKLIKLTEKRMKLEEDSRMKQNNMLDAATNFFNSFARGQNYNFPNFPKTQASSNFTNTQASSDFTNTQASSTKSVPLLLPTVKESPKQTFRLAVPATPTKPPHTVPAPKFINTQASSTKSVPLLLPTVKESPKQTFRLAVPATPTKPPHTVPAPVKQGTVVHIKPSPSLALGRVQKPIIFKTIGITLSKSNSDI